jgi:hypothetical protein
MPYRVNNKNGGTTRYASVNNHCGNGTYKSIHIR